VKFVQAGRLWDTRWGWLAGWIMAGTLWVIISCYSEIVIFSDNVHLSLSSIRLGPSSILAKHSAQNHKIKGLNPAFGTEKERKGEKVCNKTNSLLNSSEVMKKKKLKTIKVRKYCLWTESEKISPIVFLHFSRSFIFRNKDVCRIPRGPKLF